MNPASSASLLFRFTDTDVLTAPPKCGLLTVPDLLRQAQRWCTTRGPALIVDLSGVEETEPVVFRTLLRARRHCRAKGRELYVVEPPPGVLPPNADGLLREMLPFYPDLRSAELAVLEAWTPIPA
jgi:hypothetical protein